MSYYNFLSEKLILPVSDKLTGWNVARSLKFLKNSQYWSKDQIQYYQLRKLQKLLEFAYKNIPYYTDIFDQYQINPEMIDSLDKLKKIPVLTKPILVENFNSGKFGERQQKFLFNQSSGSTGLKTQYYVTPEAYGFNLATNLRGWGWMGYQSGDKMIKVSQNERKSKLKKYQDAINRTKLFASEYSNKSTREFVGLLRDYKPEFLRCYPDPLLYFSSKLSDEDVMRINIKAINTTGNILFPDVRKQVEEKFRCEIFDSYSCDNGPNVFECPSHTCYHVAEEQGICEVVDDNGNILTEEGQVGRLIITNLVNYATPFIRYDTMDYVELGPEECTCGRKHRTFKRIIGRNNDIIATPEGQMLIAQTFTTYFKYVEGVTHFQVIQEKTDHIVFKLVCTEELSSERKDQILNHWIEETNKTMTFAIEMVDKIEPLPSGKYRFVVRNPSIGLKF